MIVWIVLYLRDCDVFLFYESSYKFGQRKKACQQFDDNLIIPSIQVVFHVARGLGQSRGSIAVDDFKVTFGSKCSDPSAVADAQVNAPGIEKKIIFCFSLYALTSKISELRLSFWYKVFFLKYHIHIHLLFLLIFYVFFKPSSLHPAKKHPCLSNPVRISQPVWIEWKEPNANWDEKSLAFNR